MPEAIHEAYSMAVKARSNSYSPFSTFKVGAAVVFRESGKIFSGCNVENSSYGATICAERSALVAGISNCGKQTIEAVVVVTDEEDPAVPCAMCLQVLAEFSMPTTKVVLANLEGIKSTHDFRELLPKPFVFPGL